MRHDTGRQKMKHLVRGDFPAMATQGIGRKASASGFHGEDKTVSVAVGGKNGLVDIEIGLVGIYLETHTEDGKEEFL